MMQSAEEQIDDMFEMIAGAMSRNASTIAEAHADLLNSLMAAGFTREEAMQIITSSNMMEVE